MILGRANIPPTYIRPDYEQFAKYLPQLLGDDEDFFRWLLEGSRLITVFGDDPETRTGLAVAILMQTVLRRYTTTTQTFGYLNAPHIFDKLYTQRFGDVDDFEQSLSEPALLVLANVDELTDPQYPYFLKCVADRCDRGVVTIIITTRYCMDEMMRQNVTVKYRVMGGRVVKV